MVPVILADVSGGWLFLIGFIAFAALVKALGGKSV